MAEMPSARELSVTLLRPLEQTPHPTPHTGGLKVWAVSTGEEGLSVILTPGDLEL